MIYLSAVGMVNALGNSADEIAANLIAGVAPGMRQRAGWLQGLPEAVLGGVEGDLPPVPGSFSAHRSRNNQLLLAALAQIRPAVDAAIARVGRDRVAVVLGTSTSGLDEGDEYVRRAQNGERSPQWQYPQQELGDPSASLTMRLVPARTVPKALSVIFGAVSIALVIAAPLGSFLGGIIGWRNVFNAAAVMGVLCIIWVWKALPSLPGEAAHHKQNMFALLKRPGVLALTATLISPGVRL